MSTPSPLLRTLDPPPGGWERLLSRRHAQTRESWDSWLGPAAAALTSAAAVIVLAVSWPHRHPLELDLNGARLVGKRSDGTTVRLLDGRQVVAQSSSDPNVQVYWIVNQSRQP
jgi:hypothetical protein